MGEQLSGREHPDPLALGSMAKGSPLMFDRCRLRCVRSNRSCGIAEQQFVLYP